MIKKISTIFLIPLVWIISLSSIPAYSQDLGNDTFATSRRNNQKAQENLSIIDVYSKLKPEIEKIVSVRGVRFDANSNSFMTIIASREINIDLKNFVETINKPRVNRTKEFQNFTKLIEKTIINNDPFKPEALRVIIRNTAAIDSFETLTAFNDTKNSIVRKPFAENLELIIIADTGTSMAFMPINRLDDLKLSFDDAYKIAQNNTKTVLKGANWFTEEGLLIATFDGSYETSLLAIPEIWTSIEQKLGGPIAAAIPNRERIVIGRADSIDDVARLGLIAKNESKTENSISDKVLFRENNIWIIK